MRWTDEQYAEWQRRQPAEPRTAPAGSGPKFRSKAEARYAQHLDALRRIGAIRAWDHEAITLVVGRAGSMVTRYTPDFVVEDSDGRIELHEVKGTYIREDARVKLLSAVRQWHGFRWVLIIDRRGTFTREVL